MRFLLGTVLALAWGVAGTAPPPDGPPPQISIIIDDLGRDRQAGMRVIRLPGPVACAFLPRSAHTRHLARAAHRYHKEVLLHLPMQPVAHRPVDAGALVLDMTQGQFVRALEQDLRAVPHVTGVNNHMGSLLTRHPGHMLWLMQTLNRHGPLFFVDSRTTSATVAVQVARENRVPALSRDVFLDNDRDPEAVRAQFRLLLETARRKGMAVGIGHPYRSTLRVLEQELPRLHARDVRLVPLSELIRRQQRRNSEWQASWSPSPKAAKSSKPSPSSICCGAPTSR